MEEQEKSTRWFCNYNRQLLNAPFIDDILAFATYINVEEIDKLLQRNFDMHLVFLNGSGLLKKDSSFSTVSPSSVGGPAAARERKVDSRSGMICS